MRTTKVNILEQGCIFLGTNPDGYCVRGNDEAVCFYVDVWHHRGRAGVAATTTSDNDCPVLYLEDETDNPYTIIEFPEFPGWVVHSHRGGKTLSVALTKRGE